MNKKLNFFSIRNKRINSSLKLTGGIIIFAFLIYRVGFRDIANTISKVNIGILFLAIIIRVASLIIGNFNLFILLKPIHKTIRFWKLFRYYVTSWYISFFVPGRVGSTTMIYFLRKEKIKVGKSSALFILDKILTLSWIAILSIPAFFIFLNVKQSLILISIIAFISTIGLYFIFHTSGRNIIKRLILRKYSPIFTGFSDILMKYLKKERKALILNYFATIIKWTLDCISLFLIFLSFGYIINLGFIFVVRAIITMIAMIPLTANGIGIREGLALFFFSKILDDNSVILGAYLITLILDYIIVALFFSLPTGKMDLRGMKNEK